MTTADLVQEDAVHEVLAGAGRGGAGLLTCLKTLTYAASHKGLNVAYSSNYSPETRGGLVEGCVVLSARGPIISPVHNTYSAVLAFDLEGYRAYGNRLQPGGLIVWDSSRIRAPEKLIQVEGVVSYGVPVFALAEKAGAVKLANMAMLGAYNRVRQFFSVDELVIGMEAYLPPWRRKLVTYNRMVLEAVMAMPIEEYRVF